MTPARDAAELRRLARIYACRAMGGARRKPPVSAQCIKHDADTAALLERAAKAVETVQGGPHG